MTGVPAWLFPLLVLAPLALLAAVRWLVPATGLTLADAPLLRAPARRTLAVRSALTFGLLLVVAAAAALLRTPDDPVAELLSGGDTTVVVLDVSASVSDLVYHEIAETLTLLSDQADRSAQVGLVLFSDTAYEAIPPGAAAAELRPYIRFFRPRSSPDETIVRTAGIGSTDERRQFSPTVSQGSLNFIMSPWFRKFSGGTHISEGLAAAREALDGVGSGGRVLLLSDLDNTFSDQDLLAQELATYSQRGIQLDVVALPPATVATVTLFRSILGDGTTVTRSSSLRAGSGPARTRAPDLPLAFIALASLVGLALAVHELRFAPLAWAAGGPGR